MARHRALILLLFTLLAVAAPARGGEFILRSRTLMQGPARCGVFIDDGFMLGTGGGIVLFHTADDPGDRTYVPIEGEPRDIVMLYEIAYIAANRGGLVTVDLTDPDSPVAANRFDQSRRAIRCA